LKQDTQRFTGGSSFEENRSIGAFCKNKEVGREKGPSVRRRTLSGWERDDGKTAGVGEENLRREMERERESERGALWRRSGN